MGWLMGGRGFGCGKGEGVGGMISGGGMIKFCVMLLLIKCCFLWGGKGG